MLKLEQTVPQSNSPDKPVVPPAGHVTADEWSTNFVRLSRKSQRAKSSSASAPCRVVLVSPYRPLNDFLAAQAGGELPHWEFDFLEQAEQNHEPFVHVEQREHRRPRPVMVISLGTVLAKFEKVLPDYKSLQRFRQDSFVRVLGSYLTQAEEGRAPQSGYVGSSSKPLLTAPEISRKVAREIEQAYCEAIGEAERGLPRMPQEVFDLVECVAYESWCTQYGVTYLKARKEFAEELYQNRMYDDCWNVRPDLLNLSKYYRTMLKDIRGALNLGQNEFTLFDIERNPVTGK